MKQSRLEALKLAVSVSGDDPYKALHLAAEYEKYIENGTGVVELPPSIDHNRQSRKARK